MELRKLIKDYLAEAKMMQLATSVDNQPWVCNVWFTSDDDMNIYWFSSITRRHSEEVMKNEKVAAAIVLPQSPQDPPRGLQLQGKAKMLTDKKDVDYASALYEGRIFDRETIDEFMKSPDRPHRFYKIKPEKFVLFDVVNFPEDSRREYVL